MELIRYIPTVITDHLIVGVRPIQLSGPATAPESVNKWVRAGKVRTRTTVVVSYLYDHNLTDFWVFGIIQLLRTFISIIKFLKIREFFPKRMIHIIRTEQLCLIRGGDDDDDDDDDVCLTKARFPLPELTARVNGPSWRVTGFHYPSRRPVLTGARFH